MKNKNPQPTAQEATAKRHARYKEMYSKLSKKMDALVVLIELTAPDYYRMILNRSPKPKQHGQGK